MSSKKREAVKVVLMDTQYVEADPMSFKSVVQKLTGKDSSVAWIKESNPPADVIKREISVQVDKLDGVVEIDYSRDHIIANDIKGMSFKDLDRWILEFPPPEELQFLWTESNFS